MISENAAKKKKKVTEKQENTNPQYPILKQ